VLTFQGDPETTARPFPATNLDAGTITLTGPKGTRTLNKLQGGGYDSRLPADYLVAGTYTMEGSGGTGANSIGAFRVTLQVPPNLTWTNKAQVATINRAAGQEITWSGGDPNGRVSITGIGFEGQGANSLVTVFYCTERNSARRFLIPAEVLLAVPPAAASSEIPFNGFLFVGDQTGPVNFTAPRLDRGTGGTSSTDGKTVKYQ
jgi:hypothetical protein